MYIYNKELNQVEEQPTREKPIWDDSLYEMDGYDYLAKFHYVDDDYQKHIAILKSYSVYGTHSWKDKQEVVEGKDFKIENRWYYDAKPEYAKDWAVPLPVIKQESEDELWEELHYESVSYNSFPYPKLSFAEFIQQRKTKFSITRKTQ